MLKHIAATAARSLGYEVSRHHGLCGGLGFLQIGAGDVIFDVGAHIGNSVAEMRLRYPSSTIHAFEPFPDFRKLTAERFSRDPAIFVHGVAMSDMIGTAPMVTSDFNLSLVGPLRSSRQPTTYLDVETNTLDAFTEQHEIDRIKLLKIDAEGHDLAILRGASALLERQVIDAIIVEVMFIPLYDGQPLFSEIYSFLHARQMTLFDIRQIKKSDSGQFRYANAVFIAPQRG